MKKRKRTRIVYKPSLPPGFTWRFIFGEWVQCYETPMNERADAILKRRFAPKRKEEPKRPTGLSARASKNCKIRY